VAAREIGGRDAERRPPLMPRVNLHRQKPHGMFSCCDGARSLSSPQKENPLPQTQLNPFKILFILAHSTSFLWLT